MEIKTFSQKPKWSKQAWSGRPFNRFLGNKALMEPTMCINYENKTKVDSTFTRQQWVNHQPPTHTSHKNSKLERKRERKKKEPQTKPLFLLALPLPEGPCSDHTGCWQRKLSPKPYPSSTVYPSSPCTGDALCRCVIQRTKEFHGEGGMRNWRGVYLGVALTLWCLYRRKSCKNINLHNIKNNMNTYETCS